MAAIIPPPAAGAKGWINARFRRPVFPGDQLHVHVSKQRHRGNVWKFEGRATVRGQLMAEAVFAAMIMDD